MEVLIEKYGDNPLVLIVVLGFWFLGKYGEKILTRILDKRTVRIDQYDADEILMKQTTAEIAADYDAEKVFIISHDEQRQTYSVICEYTRTLKKIEDDYQRVPYDQKANWAIGILQDRGRIVCHTLKEVGNEGHKNQMKRMGLGSWYCFKLTNKGRVIGSLNVYFKRPHGMDLAGADTLIGRLSLLSKLLYNWQKDKEEKSKKKK